jgi:integrase
MDPRFSSRHPPDHGSLGCYRHAHYLGKYDSPEGRERYHRLVAELHAGRHALAPHSSPPGDGVGLTVGALILAYVKFADGYYVKDGRPTVEPTNIRLVLRPVRRLYGSTPASSFGPLALKAVREELVRAGNCRTEINCRVARVVRMFKWGVSEELVPPAVHEALRAVPGLRKGRSAARERPAVGPVPATDVDAIRPHVGRQVWAMVELRRLTGMRPGEVVLMREADLDREGDVWAYRPARHKGEHHGKERVVYVGPRARHVLAPWLGGPGPYLFSPKEATRERRARMRERRRTRVQPSQASRAKDAPRKAPGDRYTVASHRKAIQAACRKAGVPRWHPHQLRHARATEVRKPFGIEASRVVLGHQDVRTAQVYAQEGRSKGVEVMRRIG